MKKLLFSSFLFLFSTFTSFACTTFFINHNGQMLFGRNYDWITDAGMVCTNLAGLSKTSMKNRDGNTISWISKYGSITFNQYGKEFPTGGMNEKGLVVELMWLDGTRYPTPDERPAVGVLQWIQFQLDNCATIDDVIAGDKIIRIASQGTTPLHYLVADANGQAATIEFFDGKMTVHKGDQLPYPVLTNDTYASSVELVNKTGTSGKSFTGNNSQQRFLEACSRVTDLKQNKVPVTSLTDYSFQILNTVAQGSYTRWSIVYDITNKKILFKTNRYPQIKQVSFSDIDFTCSSVPKGFDMNQDLQGDIVPFMKDFTIELNQRIVETAFRESGDQINASTKDIEAQWKYAGEVKCPSLRQ